MAPVDPDLTVVLATTLRVAGAAVLLAALPAIALGFVLARASFVGKSVVETLVAVPLVLPPTAIGYLLLRAFAHDGPLGPRVLGVDLDVLFTRRGAVLASAVVAFPLIARAARGAFEGVEPRLELVARTHGLSRGATFATVTLPLARRGLLAALALGFGRALGEFGATVIVAGNVRGETQTLALAIFEDIQLGSNEHALGLVGVTLAIAFALMWSVEWLSRPRKARASR